MKPFIETLTDDQIYLFDGSMGTMLYDKGIAQNISYEEANIRFPDLVLEVHREYKNAGANILTTNSFKANRIFLSKYGLEDSINDINSNAVRLAKEVSNNQTYIAGSIGPLGIRIEPYGPTSQEEAQALFKEHASVLIESGVDLIILEAFSDINELLQAIISVKSISNIPLFSTMTLNEDGLTMYGTPPEVIIQMLNKSQSDVVGFTCSVGPLKLVEPLEIIKPLTNKNICLQPNAGLPQEIHGRKVYSCSPDYMAKYIRHYIGVGVKYVGCCCGSTPRHTKEIASSIRALRPQTIQIEILKNDEDKSITSKVSIILKENKSQLAKDISEKKFVVSVELVPAKGCDISGILEKAKKLKELGIQSINIPDGPRAQSRMSSMITCLLIQQQVGIETIMHYTCRDRNMLGMQSDLLGAGAAGLRNILLITGDPPKMGPYPDSTAVFDVDSIGLTNLVNRFNRGLDMGGNPIGCNTNFFIGVGANPSAVNMDDELRKLYWKVEAGAEFVITQPVFDIAKLEAFLKKIEEYNLPVIAGIWPLSSFSNAEFLNNEVPGVYIPNEIMDRMKKAQDVNNKTAQTEGIIIARETLNYIRKDIAGIQISPPLGKISLISEILNNT